MSEQGQKESTASRALPTTSMAPQRIIGSESISKLTVALCNARAAFKPVAKDLADKFHGFRYASLSSVLDAVNDALVANNLTVFQTTRWELGEMWLDTTLCHESGEWVASVYPVFASNYFDSQKIGSALTYARRYALQAILGIAPEDDDGQAAIPRGQQQQQSRDNRQERRDNRDNRQDRREADQDQGRRAINQEFNGSGQAPPATNGNGATANGDAKPWSAYVTDTLRLANQAWMREMVREGIEPSRRAENKEVAIEPRLVNHLVTLLIDAKRTTTADLAKAGTTDVRDPNKARAAVVAQYERSPGWTGKAIEKYLATKLGEMRAALGMPDLDDGDDGNAESSGERVAGRGDSYEEALTN